MLADCARPTADAQQWQSTQTQALSHVTFLRNVQKRHLIVFHYNQQTHNYITKVYITTVLLCNRHSYMFRHLRVIIREFITDALLSYPRIFFKLQLLKKQFTK
jgi:hypothetical protein